MEPKYRNGYPINMRRIVLTSSNYKVCIGAACIIQAIYLYGVYHTGIHIGWNLCGMAYCTFLEYIYHRFLLHYAEDHPIHYYLHGKHHLKPFSPSIHVPVLYTYLLNLGAYYLTSLISPIASMNIMVMYQFCYIIFEHIHMEAHHPQFLIGHDSFRISHLYHHMKNKHLAYAFSTPTWDIVFGTFPHEVLTYNWFALCPIPLLSYSWGTTPQTSTISSS